MKLIKQQFCHTLLTIIGCLAPLIPYAQSLTLEEAVQLGLSNRPELKNTALKIQLAEHVNTKLKAGWLPQVTGAADMRWNTQLQTTILPFDITGQNPGGSSEVKFGLPFNNSLGISAEQKILAPQSKYDQQLNALGVQTEQNSAEQQQIAIRQSVTEAYYLAIFNRERIQLAEYALRRAVGNLEIAQTKEAAGTLLPNDLKRVQLDQRNAELILRKAIQDRDLAIQELHYRMGVDQSAGHEPSQSLRDILASTLSIVAPDIMARKEIQAEELNYKIQEVSQQREAASRLPVLSAYGNYSALQLSNTLNPFQSGTWYPFNYLGLRLSVPIFDGRQSRLTEEDYKIRQQISRNTQTQLTRDLGYEVQSALSTLVQARMDVEDTEANVDFARALVETDLFRYEKEVLTLTELNTTLTTLQNAETNYLNSVYSYLVALVRYRRAAGLL